MWISGWNHLWAGVLEHVLEAQAEWPARLATMRAFVRWRRVAEYRNVFARRLREFGHCELAEVVAAALNATFAHWRFETASSVLSEAKTSASTRPGCGSWTAAGSRVATG